jgi:hypothetical protein
VDLKLDHYLIILEAVHLENRTSREHLTFAGEFDRILIVQLVVANLTQRKKKKKTYPDDVEQNLPQPDPVSAYERWNIDINDEVQLQILCNGHGTQKFMGILHQIMKNEPFRVQTHHAGLNFRQVQNVVDNA